MIRSGIKIHDKFSVVIDVTYDKLFNRKKSKYTTITYLFLSDSLNINKETYPETKFYNDVRLFVKYDIPNYSLDDINKGDHSLLKNLVENTENFILNTNKKNRSLYTDQVKMFAATFSGILRKENEKFCRSRNPKIPQIHEFLTKIASVLRDFRILVEKIKKTSLERKDKRVLMYADEHISNVVEFQMMELYNYLKRKHTDQKELDQVVKLINQEQKYKKQKAYSSLKDKNVNPDELLYRRNQLKKFIEDVFYLNRDVRVDGAIVQQTLLALAAGLAMVFSTGIAFYYQQVYGNFTIPFFIALVVSYMLKDRIKWLMGLLLVSKSNSFYYDYKIRINNSLNKKIGVMKENFVFVPIKKLGKKIKAHRLKDRIIETEEHYLHEKTIQYKKKIVIYPKRFSNDLPDKNILGLTDITRFNFHRFIQYMDDPKKDYILIKKGEIYNKVANKIYHINLIQKYYTEEGIQFIRYRIIINRNGIKRIEKVPLDKL